MRFKTNNWQWSYLVCFARRGHSTWRCSALPRAWWFAVTRPFVTSRDPCTSAAQRSPTTRCPPPVHRHVPAPAGVRPRASPPPRCRHAAPWPAARACRGVAWSGAHASQTPREIGRPTITSRGLLAMRPRTWNLERVTGQGNLTGHGNTRIPASDTTDLPLSSAHLKQGTRRNQ